MTKAQIKLAEQKLRELFPLAHMKIHEGRGGADRFEVVLHEGSLYTERDMHAFIAGVTWALAAITCK